MDRTNDQLIAMVGFVTMAQDFAKYSVEDRHGFLTYALMHACQGAILSDSEGGFPRYGFTIHDYKHLLIKAIDAIMNGKPIDEVLFGFPEFAGKG